MVVLVIAVAVRLIFLLLIPVLPYVVGIAALIAICQCVRWYRGLW
jgi:hypothetical protein